MSLTEDERRRLEDLEDEVFGPSGERERGLSARMQITHTFVMEMRAMNQKIIWLLIAGVIAAVMNLVMYGPVAMPAPANQHTSIITGSADTSKLAGDESHTTVLDTATVAKQTGLSVRTIEDYIAKGRIVPAPIKGSRSWEIAADYRILPQSAAVSGKALDSAKE